MHVLSAEQYDRGGLEEIFEITDKVEADYKQDKKLLASRYWGEQVIMLFYEPSTRTRISFELAAAKLGMIPVSTENAKEFSSAAKGESIADTVRTLEQYDPAAIVIRHDQKGGVQEGASYTNIPVLNAGDGPGEHPTQALLDTRTILKEQGRLDNLHVVMGGDLRHGRTVHSLSKLLALYEGNSLTFASIPELQMEQDVKDYLDVRGVEWQETDDLATAAKDADILYWTRLQDERFGPKSDDNEEVKIEKYQLLQKIQVGFDTLTITAKSIGDLPDTAAIMHPLPRRGEVSTDIDSDRRLAIFRQVRNGMLLRMGLFEQVFSN